MQLQIAVPSWIKAGRKTRPAHAKCVSGFCQAAVKTCPWMKNRGVYRSTVLHMHRGDRRSLCPAAAARC
ncbi:MAG TPA: hypothetical protein DDZ74_09255 [Pseudomonas sp.]|nr:hypothetical protein DK184_01155 [Pseudomonas sp. RW405]RIZ41931.1 hypothetical protein CIK02_20480 [Pseudomonas putida]TFF51005.1 hypothetical protein C5609_15565 [Pseudomonas putida]TFW37972.1 hypothetical protein E4195_10455 [Pseudomonas putida]HBK49489.1 hypothetical protein [Pseudomonas sp.]